LKGTLSTRPSGRAFSAVLSMKFPVSFWTAAEARKFVFVLSYMVSLFRPKPIQLLAPAGGKRKFSTLFFDGLLAQNAPGPIAGEIGPFVVDSIGTLRKAVSAANVSAARATFPRTALPGPSITGRLCLK
jgi:hypothetical protein